MSDLVDLYSAWSKKKTPEEIEYDIQASVEKCQIAKKMLKEIDIGPIDSILEIGCGFGKNLSEIVDHTGAGYGLGCDFSEDSISFANKHFGNEKISFLRNESLDIKSTVRQIKKIHSKPFDLVILFDVLEHVPNPRTFVKEIGETSNFFFIKLPLENSIFDNYLLPKKKLYPSSLHADGHLREFHVNDVHAFVTSLGITPVIYDYFEHSIDALFPDHIKPKHFKGKLYFHFQKTMKLVTKMFLPKKIFLRLMGGGGFICIGTWSEEFVLE